MNIDLPPQYDPKATEAPTYQKWLAAKSFHATPDARPNKFSIVIPPPNVTGALHLGHAINGTIQDILTRYHRMKGDNTLWMPGIDHAGIATQAVVEKTIFEKEKKSRHDLGRDELVRRIWEWKEQYGTRILNQQAQLGASCDWDRTRFTLDDICAKAVREAFFKMFKDGLIFRGKRLVNWDTHLQTAVADDEIYHETVKGQMTSIKYPIEGADHWPLTTDHYLIVATTRPETMLGDTAVAVHPDDPRYTHLHGKFVIVPLVGRKIPIITDGLLVDPTFGTGVVKVTPAHDPNDYATGQRHHLESINLLTPDGKVNDNGQGQFLGKTYSYVGLKFATAARKQVLADLEALGLIAEAKPHEHEVGHSDRSKTPIEPFLSDQWFVRMGDSDSGIALADGTQKSGLAQAAMDAVTDGRVKITPDRYAKGYLDWLAQKRDWCISRQLWWGHRIPVWSKTVKHLVGESTLNGVHQDLIWLYYHNGGWNSGPRKEALADTWVFGLTTGRAYHFQYNYGKSESIEDFDSEYLVCVAMRFPKGTPPVDTPTWDPYSDLEKYGYTQDPDVLDTWFSSALWPLSTMGWPSASTAYASTWSRPKWAGETYTEPAVRAYFQKYVFLPAFNSHEQRAAIAMENFSCAYTDDQLEITFRNSILEGLVEPILLTMGYTKKTTTLAPEPSLLPYFYPTSVLSTARDILTLWVARMVIFGLYCHGQIPFKDVYIHAVIQDGEGRTMSKSKGNGVDPVDIIHSHGADALRFTLASMATETQDIRMPVVKDPKTGTNTSPKFDIGRNFANKIWNATRFILTNIDDSTPPLTTDHWPLTTSHLEDRWILSRLNATTLAVESAINGFHFADVAESLRTFFWTDLCDWYLEIAKARIKSGDALVQSILLHCLTTSLKLLHPMMPFITEELWSKLPSSLSNLQSEISNLKSPIPPLLITSPWPQYNPALADEAAESQITTIQSLTTAIREIQNRYPAAKGKPVTLQPRDTTTQSTIEHSRLIIESLTSAPIAENSLTAQKPANAATSVLPEVQIFIAGVIDKAVEVPKLTKRLAELQKFIAAGEAKLANEAAVTKVPEKVAQGWRDQLAKQKEELAAIEKNLAELTD